MDMMLKRARRESGIASFERQCRTTMAFGHRRKACFVLGTREHSHWFTLLLRMNDLVERYCEQQAITPAEQYLIG